LTRKNLEVLSEKENQIENSIENNNEETNDMDLEDVASVESVKEKKPVNKGKNALKSKTPVKGKQQQQQQQQKNTQTLKAKESQIENDSNDQEDDSEEDSLESSERNNKPISNFDALFRLECLNYLKFFCLKIKGTKSNNEEYFEKFQQLQKKREKLEAKTKISHRVYCPYFPDVNFSRYLILK